MTKRSWNILLCLVVLLLLCCAGCNDRTPEQPPEEEDEWDSYVPFYPVRVFASNGSRYSLDDYFTETAFEDLIDAVERLAEQFEDLYEDYF